MSSTQISRSNSPQIFRTTYKDLLLTEILKHRVLQTGQEFKLKHGGTSAHFLDTSRIYNATSNVYAGHAIADVIVSKDLIPLHGATTHLIAAAYKGIPLTVAATAELKSNYGIVADFSIVRKEAKTHGEKGLISGPQVTDGQSIILIDDVLTAGTALKELAKSVRRETGGMIIGAVVLITRMEDLRKHRALEKELGFSIFPVLSLQEIVDAQHKRMQPNSIDIGLLSLPTRRQKR